MPEGHNKSRRADPHGVWRRARFDPVTTDLIDAAKLGSLLNRLDAITTEALEKTLERSRRRELAGRLDVTDAIRAAMKTSMIAAVLPEPKPVETVVYRPEPAPHAHADPQPGQSCPECGHRIPKVDRRRLNRSGALFLAMAFRYHGQDPFKATEVIAAGIRYGITRDATQTKWWNFIERVPGAPQGWWRLTPEGVDFVLYNKRVRAYRVLTPTGEFSHYAGDLVAFSDLVTDLPKELDTRALIGV